MKSFGVPQLPATNYKVIVNEDTVDRFLFDGKIPIVAQAASQIYTLSISPVLLLLSRNIQWKCFDGRVNCIGW